MSALFRKKAKTPQKSLAKQIQNLQYITPRDAHVPGSREKRERG
jgi:hypothetical protein